MILIALGANLPSNYGRPDETILAAQKVMDEQGIHVVQSSRIWLTAPVPVSDQPWYHNAVVQVETSLSPYALLEMLQSIENDFGRVRTVRNAPRLLDLDLIAYHDRILDKPDLIVPHPRMHERAFVLMPLQDIVSSWTHPVYGFDLSDMIAKIPDEQKAQPMEITAPQARPISSAA